MSFLRTVPPVEVFLNEPKNFKEELDKFLDEMDPWSLLDPDMRDYSVDNNLIFSWKVGEKLLQSLDTVEINFYVPSNEFSSDKDFWLRHCDEARTRLKALNTITPDLLWNESKSFSDSVTGQAMFKNGDWGLLVTVENEYSYSKAAYRKLINFRLRHYPRKRDYIIREVASWLDTRIDFIAYLGSSERVGVDKDVVIDWKLEAATARRHSLSQYHPREPPKPDGLSIQERKDKLEFEISIPEKQPEYHFDSTYGTNYRLDFDITPALRTLTSYLANARLDEKQLFQIVGEFVLDVREIASEMGYQLQFKFGVHTRDGISMLLIGVEQS